MRYVFTIVLALIIGAVYWHLGQRRQTEDDVLNILGVIFVAQIFIGEQLLMLARLALLFVARMLRWLMQL